MSIEILIHVVHFVENINNQLECKITKIKRGKFPF